MNESEREAWLASRRKGLGSSDAAAVCGVSPWSTPYGVYLDKTGQLPDQPATPAMRRGLLLESAIAGMYCEETGAALEEVPHAVHPELPWMLATPDRRLVDFPKLVELKKASFFVREQWGPAGSQEVPEHYLIQVMHQLSVVGWDVCDVAALIGDDFRIYTLERNERLIARIQEIEADFWEHVQSKTPPEPDWRHASTPELLRHLYGVSGEEVELAEEELEHVNAYRMAAEAVRVWEKSKEASKAHLLHALGSASIGRLSDGTVLTRKEVKRKGYTVEPTTYLDFRIRAPKKESVTA